MDDQYLPVAIRPRADADGGAGDEAAHLRGHGRGDEFQHDGKRPGCGERPGVGQQGFAFGFGAAFHFITAFLQYMLGQHPQMAAIRNAGGQNGLHLWQNGAAALGLHGFGPGGAVVFDSSGNMYGTTPDGGAYSAGTVYELTPGRKGWRERVIHAFTGGSDGSTGSLGPLLVDASGDLYGVTELGGAHGAGTVFRMSPRGRGGWDFRTLYAFAGSPDAAFPYGGLIAGANGALYGTTYYGGQAGAGAVFNLSESANLTEAAARLFTALRALDETGARLNLKRIAALPVPRSGLGLAINDRLQRAAAPRG